MGLSDLLPDPRFVYAELPQLTGRLDFVTLLAVACILSLWLCQRTNDRPDNKPSPTKPLFEYPTIEPCTQELSQIKPVPYRPFKWGAYQ